MTAVILYSFFGMGIILARKPGFSSAKRKNRPGDGKKFDKESRRDYIAGRKIRSPLTEK